MSILVAYTNIIVFNKVIFYSAVSRVAQFYACSVIYNGIVTDSIITAC